MNSRCLRMLLLIYFIYKLISIKYSCSLVIEDTRREEELNARRCELLNQTLSKYIDHEKEQQILNKAEAIKLCAWLQV